MMRTKRFACLLCLGLALPGFVQACGETLFRTGSSMRQHMQSSQTPARILVLADANRDQPEQQERLYSGLRRVGHQVDEVTDADALTAALQAAEYDLVLAHQSEVPALMVQLADRDAAEAEDRGPTLIPILAQGTRKLEPFKVCVKDGAELGSVLRAIARAMKDSTP